MTSVTVSASASVSASVSVSVSVSVSIGDIGDAIRNPGYGFSSKSSESSCT